MVIENYTRESGVRGLERILAKLIRSVAKNIVLKENYDKTLNEEKITKILGPKNLIKKNTKIIIILVFFFIKFFWT